VRLFLRYISPIVVPIRTKRKAFPVATEIRRVSEKADAPAFSTDLNK
jgi:hypothetical protein